MYGRMESHSECMQQVLRGGQWCEQLCVGGYMCVITSACSAGVFSIPHSGYLLPRGDFVISLGWWGWRWGCEGWCCVCSCPALPRVLALPAPGGWWQGGGRDAASGVRSLCRSCRC